MNKFSLHNSKSIDESTIIILGLPDESQSHALRKGAAEAPYKIREISNIRDSYIRKGKTTLGLPKDGIKSKIFDYGNITRGEIDEVYDKILADSKIPILIGGDHSITKHVIKAISNTVGKISLVYFDAHPDFISSTTNYYGSVFYDILPNIDISTSIQIGIRTPEQEEIDNLAKYDVSVITPFDIIEKGVKQVTEQVLGKIGKNVYISVDMDCIDPAFAPGVSVPVPMGLQSLDVMYMIKSIVKRGIIGMDIMEVCPQYDIKDRTSHLASRMIGETISSFSSK
jgi:agmatinase